MARTARIATALRTVLDAGELHAWTLDALQAALAERGISADFSSVFRAMRSLAECGVVRRVVLADGKPRFELDRGHHDHLQCTGCDALVAVPCLLGDELAGRIEALTGFAIAGHSVTLTGLCRACRGAAS